MSIFFVQQALVCLMVDQANGSGQVGSCVKTGSGKNGSIKKGVVSILVETGSGRNGFGSERFSGQVGSVKNAFFKDCPSWGQFCRLLWVEYGSILFYTQSMLIGR
ncbi:hypothetical protein Hanom_Chr02g00166491 [Helianthus anomalus]